jgi:hypothetical protein
MDLRLCSECDTCQPVVAGTCNLAWLIIAEWQCLPHLQCIKAAVKGKKARKPLRNSASTFADSSYRDCHVCHSELQ